MKRIAVFTLVLVLLLTLLLPATAESTVPQELVGTWVGEGTPEGSSSSIRLTLTLAADGTGYYTFVQGTYTESYPFTLETQSETFSVTVPEDNELGITACEGAYAYADGVLSLHITTSFQSGREFVYAVACEKKADENAAETMKLTWKGKTVDIILITENEDVISYSPSADRDPRKSGDRFVKVVFMAEGTPMSGDEMGDFGEALTLTDGSGATYTASVYTNVHFRIDLKGNISPSKEQPSFGLIFAVPEASALDTLTLTGEGPETPIALRCYGEDTYEALMGE